MSVRALAEADLPQLARWLAAAHVQDLWRDAADLDLIREKYLPRIYGDEPTEVFVIVNDVEDIGIVQRYRLGSYPDWLETLAGTGLTFANAAGVDYLIGEPTHVGRGTGTEAIRSFTERLFDDYADVDHIVATPQKDNRASCRVLEKAGYELRWTGLLESDDPADAGIAALYVRDR